MVENIGLGKFLGIFGIILISLFSIIALRNFFSNSGNEVTGDVVGNVDASAGNGQVVELTLKDYNYFPNVLNFKVGEPAKIVVDTSKVRGCLSTILIPDLGIRKFVQGNDNVLEFTPTKTGEFRFSCPMAMGSGKIIVS